MKKEMSVCFCTNAEEYLTKERKSNIIVPVLGSTMFCDDRLAVAFYAAAGNCLPSGPLSGYDG